MRNYYIGLDLGGTYLKYALVDSNGHFIHKGKKPSQGDKKAVRILESIVTTVDELRAYAQKNEMFVAAIGLGSPGYIDHEKGMVKGTNPNMPYWHDIKIADYIQKATGIKTFVDNDANLMVLGEARYGAAKDGRNVIGLTLGTGVGGGIIIDHNIYRGSAFGAGEIGHICVKPGGRKCGCGKKGCLETYSSATGIVRTAKSVFHDGHKTLTAKIIFSKAQNGNPAAIDVFQSSMKYLGIGIGSLINIFNPDYVVIGGGVSKSGQFLLDEVCKQAQNHTMPSLFKKTKIVLAKLGNDSGMLGAATMARDYINGIN